MSVEIFRAIIRQATEKKRVPEYVSVHIVNAREVLCELDDLRTQLAAAQSEVSYLKGLYEDANGLRAAAEHRAETAERQIKAGVVSYRPTDGETRAAYGRIHALETELTTLRHRAEAAERERDALQKFVALQDAWETEAMGDITMLLKERNEYRHRAERMERVVEAAVRVGTEHSMMHGKPHTTVFFHPETWNAFEDAVREYRKLRALDDASTGDV